MINYAKEMYTNIYNKKQHKLQRKHNTTSTRKHKNGEDNNTKTNTISFTHLQYAQQINNILSP